MARVLIPVMARRYNPNPRGSATTTVTMAGDNPFERSANVLNATRSMLPGMGALGDDAAPAAPAAPATGINWGALATGVVQAGTQIGVAALTPKIPIATGIRPLPVVGFVPPKKPSAMPWIIGGGAVLVLGLGAFLMLRRK